MRARKSWFSFARVVDPRNHRLYNEYHQLDHRPENLALPGVLHGDRWVCTPACAAVAEGADGMFDGIHYLVNYLLEEPVEQSQKDWLDLSWGAFQEGRRPEAGLVERPFMGWFTPFKTYVNPGVRISAEALPFRPVRGVYVAINQIRDVGSSEIQEVLAWEDQTRIPSWLACRGVAGVMAHLSDPSGVRPFSTSAGAEQFNDRANLRVHVVYLENDPLTFVDELAEVEQQLSSRNDAPDVDAVLTPLFNTPLYAITPWDWTWFDAPGAAG